MAGYYAFAVALERAGRYQDLRPSRILDTSEALRVPSNTPVPADGTIDLAVAGRGGEPSAGVSAVVLNVMATDATAPGYVTAGQLGHRSELGPPGSRRMNASLSSPRVARGSTSTCGRQVTGTRVPLRPLSR